MPAPGASNAGNQSCSQSADPQHVLLIPGSSLCCDPIVSLVIPVFEMKAMWTV